MRKIGNIRLVIVVLVCAGFVYAARSQSVPAASKSTAGRSVPLVLEKNEGERRIHRPAGNKMGTAPFTIKVDPKNGASRHLVMFTEDLPPGASIPAHKHPEMEEIIVLQTGRSRVHLGDTVREVGPGATVFIPPGTWISVDSIGTEPVSLVAIFSQPGFEEYMRAISVREGETNAPLSKEQLDGIRAHHPHAVTYK
ncbi:MAG: cupin domain-containing protein [Acidobacteriia bacterium]|nr:cupin domain-containing protein [Terriglobia bacterium]